MKRFKRSIATIALAAFFLNIAMYDTALGQISIPSQSSDNLAPPSRFSKTVDTEEMEMATIKLACMGELTAIARASQTPLGQMTAEGLEGLIEKLDKYRNTKFGPPELQFMKQDMESLGDDRLCLQCRLTGKNGMRVYYAVFELPGSGNNWNVEVYKEDEFTGMREGGLFVASKKLPKRSDQFKDDAASIERYITHEEGMDRVIRYAHEKGLAAKPNPAVFDYKETVESLKRELNIDIPDPHSRGLLSIEEREFYLINCTEDITKIIREMPMARIVASDGVERDVYYAAHTSNNAIHVFVNQECFNLLTNGRSLSQVGRSELAGRIRRASDHVNKEIVHEMGVAVGMVPVFIGNAPRRLLVNELDRRYAAAVSSGHIVSGEKLRLEIVDLSSNLAMRDFADAADEDSLVKGAWRSISGEMMRPDADIVAMRRLASPECVITEEQLARLLKLYEGIDYWDERRDRSLADALKDLLTGLGMASSDKRLPNIDKIGGVKTLRAAFTVRRYVANIVGADDRSWVRNSLSERTAVLKPLAQEHIAVAALILGDLSSALKEEFGLICGQSTAEDLPRKSLLFFSIDDFLGRLRSVRTGMMEIGGEDGPYIYEGKSGLTYFEFGNSKKIGDHRYAISCHGSYGRARAVEEFYVLLDFSAPKMSMTVLTPKEFEAIRLLKDFVIHFKRCDSDDKVMLEYPRLHPADRTADVRTGADHPTAAPTTRIANLSDLAPHPFVNALIAMMLDKAAKGVNDFVIYNPDLKTHWFGRESVDNGSFLDIFRELAKIKAREDLRGRIQESDEEAVFDELVKRCGGNNYGYNLADLKKALSLQAEHFGVEKCTIYAMRRYNDKFVRDTLAKHVSVERGIHQFVIDNYLGGNIGEYRRWRNEPDRRVKLEGGVNIMGQKILAGVFLGGWTYNEFAMAAHRFAQSQAPVPAGHTTKLESPQGVYADYPTAAVARTTENAAVTVRANPKLTIKADSDKAAKFAARIIVDQVKAKPDSVIGLATGGTQVSVYKEIICLTRQESVDWSHVKTFNLDEYCAIYPDHPEMYRNFMNRNLFEDLVKYGRLNIRNTHLPDTEATETDAYLQMIEDAGGVDLWLLGMGRDGHYAFLEPVVMIDKEARSLINSRIISHTIRGWYDMPVAIKVAGFNEFYIPDMPEGGYEEVRRAVTDTLNFQAMIRVSLHHSKRLAQDCIDAAHRGNRSLTMEGAKDQLKELGAKLFAKSKRVFYVPLSRTDRQRLQEYISLHYRNVTIEPLDAYFGSYAKIVDIALPTIIDNSRYFRNLNEVPIRAFTATGIVRDAKRVIQVVTGKEKAAPLGNTLLLEPTPECPSTILRQHPDYTIIADKDAASGLSGSVIAEFSIDASVQVLSSPTDAERSILPYAGDKDGFLPADTARAEDGVPRSGDYADHPTAAVIGSVEMPAPSSGEDTMLQLAELLAYSEQPQSIEEVYSSFKTNCVSVRAEELRSEHQLKAGIVIATTDAHHRVTFFIITDLRPDRKVEATVLGVDQDEAAVAAAREIGFDVLLNARRKMRIVKFKNPGELKRLFGLFTDAAATPAGMTDIRNEIEDATRDAAAIKGLIPTDEANRYTLILPAEFFMNSEYADQKERYKEHFSLVKISGRDGQGAYSNDIFIRQTLNEAAGRFDKTVVMVPTGMPREKLEELTRANVRFLQVNMEILQSYDREYGAKGDYRGDFQRDTYVIMRLLRRVGEEDLARSEGEDVFEVSPVYRLLYFYLRSHFAFSEDIVIGDYINAVVHGDVARLIKGCLVLRPAERYQEVSYELVTQAAIRA